LDEKFLSPYDYWQFWRNTDDRDVIKFLKIFTNIEIEEIDNLKNLDINKLKILLANKTTEMLHGLKQAKDSEKTAKETFSENSTGSNLPFIKLDKKMLEKKINIIDFIVFSKLENSKSEIRRLIKGNAIKINNKNVESEKILIDKSFFNDGFLKLSIGKKRHIKVELS
jgi:tyrosyl-tRNA synthetase